jgi:glycoprotein-N-acetylgalactosamine 3-beta-galactosyltransferase
VSDDENCKVSISFTHPFIRYAVVENLRFMLHAYSPDMPLYFGCKFRPFVAQGYMSGGAGYAISREALRRFAERGIHDNHTCESSDVGAEDLEMGKKQD